MRRRNRIRLNEAQLHRVIKESVKRILRESAQQNRREIFTVSAFNDTQDEGVDFMPETTTSYYDIDEAVRVADELAREYQDEPDKYTFYVFAGEYETPSGDVFGENESIYSTSNHD